MKISLNDNGNSKLTTVVTMCTHLKLSCLTFGFTPLSNSEPKLRFNFSVDKRKAGVTIKNNNYGFPIEANNIIYAYGVFQ